MNLVRLSVTYLVTLIGFLAIDALWLGLIAPNFYKKQIDHLLAAKPNLWAALVFYLIFVLGLLIFVIIPAHQAQNITQALILGAAFGFITYATYDLTNLATLKDWPILITLIDLSWGTFLGTITALIGFMTASKIG